GARADGVAQLRREQTDLRQLQNWHDTLITTPRLADNHAAGDFGELLEDPVDLSRTDAHPAGLQYGVRAAEKCNAAGLAMDADIIAMPPYVFAGIGGEVGRAVFATVRVVPEVQGHGGRGRLTD